jgi:hypothetical protein
MRIRSVKSRPSQEGGDIGQKGDHVKVQTGGLPKGAGDGQVNVSPYKTDAARSRDEVAVTRISKTQDRPGILDDKTRIKKSTLKCFLGHDRRVGSRQKTRKIKNHFFCFCECFFCFFFRSSAFSSNGIFVSILCSDLNESGGARSWG